MLNSLSVLSSDATATIEGLFPHIGKAIANTATGYVIDGVKKLIHYFIVDTTCSVTEDKDLKFDEIYNIFKEIYIL